ncbi:MAG: hypothetical protein PHP42_05735 [Bacteroidota bacterium]|nr:hypothetical protein [Bacteroidota bacterium]
MKATFTASEIKKIGKVLGVEGKLKGNNFRFEFAANSDHRQLALEVYPHIAIGKKKGNLISAYTHNTHFQLHFCNAYVVSTDVGEVTFISETKDKVSAIVVEREGGCTFYSNVDRSMLSGDYRMLAIDVMLAGIALSLTQGSATPKRKMKKR